MPLRLKDTHSSLERVSCVEMVADPIYPEEKLEHTFVRYIVPVPINGCDYNNKYNQVSYYSFVGTHA